MATVVKFPAKARKRTKAKQRNRSLAHGVGSFQDYKDPQLEVICAWIRELYHGDPEIFAHETRKYNGFGLSEHTIRKWLDKKITKPRAYSKELAMFVLDIEVRMYRKGRRIG